MRDSTFDNAEPQSHRTRGADSRQLHRAALDALPYRGQEVAANLLRRVFHRFPGSIAVRLWTGAVFQVGAAPLPPDSADPPFVLLFRNPRVVCEIALGRDPLRLADAYFRGEVDIEGDLFAA